MDGKSVISGLLDSRIMIWDLMELKLPRILRGHLEGVNCIAVLPDGRRFLSGSFDKTVKLWDLETGVVLRTYKKHSKWI
ncbi:MAG: WD40 repeat domain-containing protein, partial [Candidatus Heimdallarchaeaceae archaeon]